MVVAVFVCRYGRIMAGQKTERLAKSAMKFNFGASAYSFFLHAMVVVGALLYCHPSESQKITSAEYLTVSIVNLVSDSSATQNSSASADPLGKPIPKKLVKPQKTSPVKLVAGEQKIEHQTEPSKSLKQQKSEFVAAFAVGKKIPQSLNPAKKAELSSTQINDGATETKVVGVVGGSGESTDLEKHKTVSGRNSQAVTGDPDNSPQNRYVRMNYDYIRQIVARNLSFPDSARKRRLCGKIEVSFLIGAEGRVEDIRITSSSGHTLLDRSVIAAVRRSAPFPKSPAVARIVLPIVFRLK